MPFKFLIKLFLWIFLAASFISISIMFGLRVSNPPSSSFIELNKQRNNSNIRHQWVDIEQVSLYFPLAILASEDQQFESHFGFDLEQIKQAVRQNEQQGSIARGASTITQQTVKNLLLWPGRSYLRKALEAWFTIWMELIVPKYRILELYMNFAQFGKSVFGVKAASLHYYSIDPSKLNPRQSALLVSVLPTPSRSNPANPSIYLKQRAAHILDQMPRMGGRRIIREMLPNK